MKFFLVIVAIIHGLIHLIGFAKAFKLAEVNQLTQTISKPMGILWFVTAILFVVSAVLLFVKKDYWWALAIAGVVLSQVLIFLNWPDAKFGTIANVIILIASIIGYGTWSYYSKYQNDVKNVLQQEAHLQNSLLNETDIQHLPDPVKKYLRYTGSIGKPKVNNFRVAFKGKIRKNEQSEWMPFASEQYNFMETPTRLFFMKAVMKHMPVAGYHCFKNGTAFMDIRLLSLFKVQYQSGKEMDVAETVTFFNDMCCMAPATLIDKRINWLKVNSNKVKAAFTNNSITIFAWLYFNDKGELVNFISDDRYSADAGKKLPWSTPLKDYKETNGYKLAGYADAVYSYPEGDLCYGTFSLAHFDYNCKDFN